LDLPADAVDPVSEHRALLDDLRTARDQRWPDCFGASVERLSRLADVDPDGPLPAASLRAGRLTLDRAAGRVPRAVSNGDLRRPRGRFEEDRDLVCPGLYVRQVPLGGGCESDHDCPDPATSLCGFAGPDDACMPTRCLRRAPLGASCAAVDCERGLGCNGDTPPRLRGPAHGERR
jgi:hypothetical protein